MRLTSEAFDGGGRIPVRFTCDGEDLSPPLRWSEVPEEARRFVLVMDDPDAPMGTWIHWVVYDIPGALRAMPEAIPADAVLPTGGVHGENSWGRVGYGGPCPPSGTHRYRIRLLALERAVGLEPGAEWRAVIDAARPAIVGEARLEGTYSRSSG